MKTERRPRWVSGRFGNCRDVARNVSTGVPYTWNVYLLFPFAQLLVPFVSQFRELFGLGEQLYFFAILFSRSAIRVRKDNGSNTSM